MFLTLGVPSWDREITMQNKTERFIEATLGSDSAFYEMLCHLCENPDEALKRNIPMRLKRDIEYVLKKCVNDTNK